MTEGERSQFQRYSMRRKEDSDTYDWCVFVANDAQYARTIARVEYTLHLTFREPHQIVSNPESRFALVSSGSGGFRIRIVVVFNHGTTEQTHHELTLHDDKWPRPQAPTLEPGSPERNMLQVLEDARKHRWRRPATLGKAASIPEGQAAALLEELASRGICRRAGFDSLDGQPLWGACSVIGALPAL